MSLEYISGFFDADGSISLIRIHSNEHKSIQISISNNEKTILEEIQAFLWGRLKIKGAVSTKKARRPNHSSNFELKYTRNNALKLIEHLSCHHPKKVHRIETALKFYKSVTKRNGKYNEKDLARKLAFEKLFYWSIHKDKKGYPKF